MIAYYHSLRDLDFSYTSCTRRQDRIQDVIDTDEGNNIPFFHVLTGFNLWRTA